MKFYYTNYTLPNKWTFEIPEIKRYLEDVCAGKKVLFPYAGKTRIKSCKYSRTIDINPDVLPDIVGDNKDVLLEMVASKVKYDIIVLDPPFSHFQSHATYKLDGKKHIIMTIVRDCCDKLLRPKGLIITFGFNSVGMGKKRGYKKRELHVFCHGGNRNDTLMLVEQKVQSSLEDFIG